MNATNPLAAYEAFLLDVDGVLVRGGEPIQGAPEAVAKLQQLGTVHVLSNNSTLSRQQTGDKLARLGFAFEPARIATSSYIAARYLLETFGPQRIWPLGEDGIRIEAEAAGHTVVDKPSQAQWVVAGMRRDLVYADLVGALRAHEAGARLLATNADATFPSPKGFLPGAGVVVGALRGLGMIPQQVIGKPNPIAYDITFESLTSPRHRTLMIGDRLETDILGASHAGVDSALVLTGVSSASDIRTLEETPAWISDSLHDLSEGRLRRPHTDSV